MRVRSWNRYVGGEDGIPGSTRASTLTISRALRECGTALFVKIPSTPRPSLDLYFHSGFHFLLFSVRRTRPFASHVTNTHRGTALAFGERDSNLDFHAVRTRRRETDRFVRFIRFSRGCHGHVRRDDALYARNEDHWSARREFYLSPDTSITIAEQDDPRE